MSFYRAFYHLVWTTKYRSGLLTPDVEPTAHDIIRSKAIQLEAMVFALNGTDNHVHMVVTIPPKMAVSDFVGQVKGITTFRLNQSGTRSVPFAWQNEFGMFTFDEKRLPNYVSYVERQKEHHAENHLIPILERVEATVPPSLRETPTPYLVDDTEWWETMLTL
jgi:putative transposase